VVYADGVNILGRNVYTTKKNTEVLVDASKIGLELYTNTAKYMIISGTAVAQWLRFCATNRKVACSIPAGVSGIFIDIKSFRSHYGPAVDSVSNGN